MTRDILNRYKGLLILNRDRLYLSRKRRGHFQQDHDGVYLMKKKMHNGARSGLRRVRDAYFSTGRAGRSSVAQKEFRQIYPHEGWVEHDPMDIWSTQIGVAQEAELLKTDAIYEDIDSIRDNE